MRIARAFAAAALAVVWIGATPAGAADAQRELAGEAFAQAFTLRATADMGGAAALPFYFGSYADAFLSTPPATADGQASWYNFGIAETAIFKPPDECTPEDQAARMEQAVEDVTSWVTGQAIPQVLRGNVPVAPVPTLPCTERFPGFAQSRSPASGSIGGSASDDLLTPPGGVVQGGSFVAETTPAPSQSSDALVAGLRLDPVVRIGSARALATTALEGDTLVASAIWILTDLCVAPGPAGCALEIEHIRQTARVERAPDGTIIASGARTVIAGVRGLGPALEVTAADLRPGLAPVDLGGHLLIQAVSTTGGCGDPATPGVADAGGLRIVGRGREGGALPVRIVGNAIGGGVLLGGACASGRLGSLEIPAPPPFRPPTPADPGRTVTVPGGPGIPGVPPANVPQAFSPPRFVEREGLRYVTRGAPAWRTAPYWGSVLAALAVLAGAGYAFRRTRAVAPIAAAADRFARRFVRG